MPQQTRQPVPHVRLIPAIVAAAILSLGCLTARAAVAKNSVVEDGFNDGGLSNGADPLDAAWSSVSGNGGFTVTTDNGSPGIDDGNALSFMTNSTFQGFVGAFAAQTLTDDRDRIKLSFDYRLPQYGNQDAAFRIGLLDSTSASGANDSAYFVATSTGSVNTASLVQNSALDSPPASGFLGGGNQDGIASDNNLVTSDSNVHHFEFVVQRTSSSRIDLSARIGTAVISAADTDAVHGPLQTTFDRIGIETGNNSNAANTTHTTPNILADNFKVQIWNNRFDDTFDTSAGAGTRNDDTTDPNDIAWYTKSSTSQSLSVVSDDNLAGGQIGSNNALAVTNTGTFGHVIGNFQYTSLDRSGDAIDLSFDLRLTSLPSATNGGFRFGLFNSGSTQYNGDNQASKESDDVGYHVQLGVNTTNAVLLQEFTGGEGSILGGSGPTQTIASNGSFAGLDDMLAHHFDLLLTRVAGDGVNFVLTMDGVEVLSGTDTTGAFTDFNEIGFAEGNATYNFLLDNVNLDAYHVPAPAALPAGLAMMWLMFGLCVRPRSLALARRGA